MELDLWEGQFNLSSPILEQFTTSLSTEELQQLGLMEGDSSTCWGEDSTVTMGTVRMGIWVMVPALSSTRPARSQTVARSVNMYPGKPRRPGTSSRAADTCSGGQG